MESSTTASTISGIPGVGTSSGGREKMLGRLDGIIETNVGQGVYAYIG